jgi:hypothetical protein
MDNADTWTTDKDITVLDPGEGVCADPRRGVAILGIGGPQRGMMSIS